MSKVILKNSYTVQPAEPTWSGIMPLSVVDQIGYITHVPNIYFYKPPQKWLKPDDLILRTLQDSLSRLLVYYYPVAGRLRWIGGGRLCLVCNAAGVQLTEAITDANLEELGDNFSTSPICRYLVPTVDYGIPMERIPLLLVQMTKFRCGGISLSYNLSHAVADGTSAIHFISEWARMACGKQISIPFLDRRIPQFGNKSGLFPLLDHKDFDLHLPSLIGECDNVGERRKEITPAMLILTESQIQKLKKMANDKCKSVMVNPSRPYTRYETIAGHIWRSACKARAHKSEQETALAISVDLRKRMQPMLPFGFFGNAVLEVTAVGWSGELVSRPLGYAASKIRETIAMVTDDYVKSKIEYLKNLKDLSKFQERTAFGGTDGPYYGNPSIAVSSWITFPLCGLDFGWGKEVYMGRGSYDFDGDTVIMPNPNGNGDGSLLVALSLQVSHMEAFKKHFYEDI